MTTPSSTLDVKQMFLDQAQMLCQGAELLPGGEEALARRLQKAVETETPLRVKLGLDPTRPDLHLGHTVVLRKLRMFQDLGHQAVLIIGDATAMIGDPSGKNQTRPPLTEEEVQANAQTYLDQAGKVIDVNKAEIVRNSDWFQALNLQDFLKLSAMVTVAQILTRDDFHKRYTENRPISLHELFYPLMQGYDSVVIGADIELGGTDQRFNNLMGRELQLSFQRQEHSPHPVKEEPQLVLLLPLLEGTDGKIKMSKSYPDHCINLTDTPEMMFGKMMSLPDEMIARYETLLTPMSKEQIEDQVRRFALPPEQGGINPRDAKALLGKWIVGQYYGQDAADSAEAAFISQFTRKEIPDDIPEITLAANTDHHVPTLLTEHALTPSKGEARRLIQGGGVKLNGEEKLTDPDAQLNYPPAMELVLQVGKRKFIKIHFE